MVRAVRAGRSVRSVAMEYGVSVGTVAYWVEHARGQRLDRVSFDDRKPGRAWNRIRMNVEARILSVRRTLREDSVLGEYGPDAIGLALQEDSSLEQLPSRTTIYRVLERHGVLDGTHRQRRPAPPKGWHLPALANGKAELDSFDFIEDLKIAGGPLVSVLTATSGCLGGRASQRQGDPRSPYRSLAPRRVAYYAQFDNDTIFQGAHQFTDTVGRVSRLCLALQVIPVFAAPPREHGFQNAIEGFNALWQSKVWQRHHCPDLASLVAVSGCYITAYRVKTAARREAAPNRSRFPKGFKLNLNTPLKGTMIYLRRSDDQGNVPLLAQTFPVAEHWVHRLVRCEVDFTHQRIRFYAMRRRDPHHQPLLREIPYHRPNKPFQGKPSAFN